MLDVRLCAKCANPYNPIENIYVFLGVLPLGALGAPRTWRNCHA